MIVTPGEIYVADIFEGGMRPVIILTREQLNRGSLYLAVPVTSSRVHERKRYANYIFLPAGSGGLREDSVAVTHLIQPVRQDALQARWGQIRETLFAQVQLGVAWSIGMMT